MLREDGMEYLMILRNTLHNCSIVWRKSLQFRILLLCLLLKYKKEKRKYVERSISVTLILLLNTISLICILRMVFRPLLSYKKDFSVLFVILKIKNLLLLKNLMITKLMLLVIISVNHWYFSSENIYYIKHYI